MATEDIERDAKAAAAALKQATDEVKSIAEKAVKEVQTLGSMQGETKAHVDKLLNGMTEATKAVEAINARLDLMEQKSARRGGFDGPAEIKSAGELFVEDEKFKGFVGGSSRRGTVEVAVERKNITSATSTLGTTADVSSSLVVAQRIAPVPLPMRPMAIRALVAPGETSSNAIEYAVMVSRINNAATVAEGALKPQSDLTFDLRNARVTTIAHLYTASRQIMDDAPALRSIIDGEARYGLEYVEDAQMLYGDGTGVNLLGIVPQARAYAAPFAVTGETRIDRLRLAALTATLALYPASGFVLNPLDWAAIEMTKDGQGRYLVGDPTGQIAPRLWGLPVVPSFAMQAGNFLAGAFRTGAQIFDRMAVEITMSTEHADYYARNLIAIRAEERLAFVVKQPNAFVYGALPT